MDSENCSKYEKLLASLGRHPRKIIVISILMLSGILGLSSGSWRVALTSIAVMSLFWILVLFIARTNTHENHDA